MAHPAEWEDEPLRRFSRNFAGELRDLFDWRRDVRRFSAAAAPEALVLRLLEDAARMAPSVGLSQPSRFVLVESAQARRAALANFRAENETALAGYEGERKKLYAGLKLSGMKEAPIQIAAFCDEATAQGSGLGSSTMPESLRYSVVCAVMQFWLALRAEGLGLGWVSILDPARLGRDLGVDPAWALIGYLCVGWPEEEHLDPELERAGWESRRLGADLISKV